MPRHRRSERLPKRLLDKVKASGYSEFFGNLHSILGGGLRGARCGAARPLLPDGGRAKRGTPLDVQYTLKDGILSRAEFVRGLPAIPVHIAHFNPDTGRRFSTVLDCFG